MFGVPQRRGDYSPVLSDQDHVFDPTKPRKKWSRLSGSSLSFKLICITTLIIFLTISFISGTLIGRFVARSPSTQIQNRKRCDDLVTRREWRTLSVAEKQDYLSAVQCLRNTPSRLHKEYSLYDDFPWLHTRVGNYSIHAATFLAWHRYFIHSYERALREDCHYQGHLSYWDWSLDWEDISKAPVWDNDLGFGGNGNPESKEINSLGIGQCVESGPFALLSVPYVSSKYAPHCLSRGFNLSAASERQNLRPQVLDELMKTDDYEQFNLGLEDAAHVSIPHIVRGDFLMFTAPYDPVFFLHHTQLDRLWWLWQKQNLETRLFQYRGAAAFESTENASLTDILRMGGFIPDVEVGEIIDSESELLCYRY